MLNSAKIPAKRTKFAQDTLQTSNLCILFRSIVISSFWRYTITLFRIVIENEEKRHSVKKQVFFPKIIFSRSIVMLFLLFIIVFSLIRKYLFEEKSLLLWNRSRNTSVLKKGQNLKFRKKHFCEKFRKISFESFHLMILCILERSFMKKSRLGN